MKKVIIIGGTSGIGRGLTELLFKEGWKVAVTGRRLNLLQEIQSVSGGEIAIEQHDIRDLSDSIDVVNSLFYQLEKVDLVIVSAGVSELNEELDADIEEKVISTNVNAVAKIYELIFSKFKDQGFGHLVGISSLAGMRGNRYCASYSASKAFQINYMEALRGISKKYKLNIKVTDVRPGFVDTAMSKGEGLFWVAPVDKVVSQIYKAILRNKRKVYVTKRWRFIAIGMKVAPSYFWEKF